MSKSDFLRREMKRWYELQDKSEIQLINDIAAICQQEWDIEKQQNGYKVSTLREKFEDFLKELNTILKRKGLSDYQISEVKNRIKR